MVLRAIWQFIDQDVTHKILYGPEGSWCPYTIQWVTVRSINCHLARSAMNYLLYYTQYYTCKSVRRHVFVIVYLRQKTSSDKIRKKTLYYIILKYWPVNILNYWPVALTKTNRENINVKHNIIQLKTGCEGSNKFIVPRNTNYFPTWREIVYVSGDNKLATSRNNRFLAVLLYFSNWRTTIKVFFSVIWLFLGY